RVLFRSSEPDELVEHCELIYEARGLNIAGARVTPTPELAIELEDNVLHLFRIGISRPGRLPRRAVTLLHKNVGPVLHRIEPATVACDLIGAQERDPGFANDIELNPAVRVGPSIGHAPHGHT